jgi:hypothetical protein
LAAINGWGLRKIDEWLKKMDVLLRERGFVTKKEDDG